MLACFKRLALGTILVCCLSGAAGAEEPQSQLDKILARGVLLVGTTGDYKPFTWRNPDTGKFEGVDIEQAESLGAALGVKVEFVQTTWPTLAADFASRKFDLAMGGVSVTFDRARKGYFSIPYLREGKTPIARCADTQRFAGIADIDKAEVRVVVNPGGTNERFARAHFKAAPVRVFPDNRAIFDEIAQGRADVMVTDVSETKYQARQHPGVLCSVHPDKPFDFAEKAYWMPRDEPLRTFVNTWLHISLASGSFAAITRKWMD